MALIQSRLDFDLLAEILAAVEESPARTYGPKLDHRYFGLAALLSAHPLMRPEWMRKHLAIPFSITLASAHTTNFDVVRRTLDEFEWKFGCSGLSKNPHFDISWYEATPERAWCFGRSGLSASPRFCMEWYIRYPDKDWHFGSGGVSMHSRRLRISDVLRHPDLPWCFSMSGLSYNRSLTVEWLKAFPHKDWTWLVLAVHPNFEPEWLQYAPADVRVPMGVVAQHPRWNPSWPGRCPPERCLPQPLRGPPMYKLTWDRSCLPWMLRPGNPLPKVGPPYAGVYNRIKNFDISWVTAMPGVRFLFGRGGLSAHPNFEPSWVDRYPDAGWYFGGNGGVSDSPKLDVSWIRRFPDRGWCGLSVCRSVNFSFVWLFDLRAAKLWPLPPHQRALAMVVLANPNKPLVQDQELAKTARVAAMILIGHIFRKHTRLSLSELERTVFYFLVPRRFRLGTAAAPAGDL